MGNLGKDIESLIRDKFYIIVYDKIYSEFRDKADIKVLNDIWINLDDKMHDELTDEINFKIFKL